MKTICFAIGIFLSLVCAAQTPEEILRREGIQLQQLPAVMGNYVNAVRVGNLIFLSGKGPRNENGEYLKGKLGVDLSVEHGYAAARTCAIIQLSVLKDLLGDLTKIKRIVKVNGYVNCAENFYDQPKVMNGFSDLMITVFGEKGKHARTALGANALPFNMAVEVEMIVEVE